MEALGGAYSRGEYLSSLGCERNLRLCSCPDDAGLTTRKQISASRELRVQISVSSLASIFLDFVLQQFLDHFRADPSFREEPNCLLFKLPEKALI